MAQVYCYCTDKKNIFGLFELSGIWKGTGTNGVRVHSLAPSWCGLRWRNPSRPGLSRTAFTGKLNHAHTVTWDPQGGHPQGQLHTGSWSEFSGVCLHPLPLNSKSFLKLLLTLMESVL